MPLTRFKLSAIEDGGIATADLADGAVTTAKINDGAVTLAKTDSLFVNTEVSGSEALRVPTGTTAQRANAQSGDIRFNTDNNLMEYYTGTEWKIIDTPPNISSVSPDNFDTAGDTITISGSFFDLSATVKVIANDGSEFTPSTVTNTSSSEISFEITQAMVDDDNDPYDVKVTNPSGQSHILANALDYAPEPVFTVASGSLASIYDTARSAYGNITTGATSVESDATITYAITSGSLPSGLSMSTSTGTISGTADSVGSNTTSNFTITATATDGDGNTTTNSRAYSITVYAPTVTSFTSVGSGTFAVPRGVTSVEALVIGGGGGGAHGGPANDGSGGGGGGGFVYHPSYPVTPEGTEPYFVGERGFGGNNPASPSLNWEQAGTLPAPTSWKTWTSGYSSDFGGRGGNSQFGTLLAIGGGGGGFTNQDNPNTRPGGSAGGAGGGGASQSGGTGIQPSQPNPGAQQYGNSTPGNPTGQPYTGGGGSGAGGGAPSGGGGQTSPGGSGLQNSITGSSVYYSAGGGGGYGTAPPGHPSSTAGGVAGVGGHGHGGGSASNGQAKGTNGYPSSQGISNRGHGGGSGAGGNHPDNPNGNWGGLGDAGVVIIKY